MGDIGREVPEDEKLLWRLIKQEYQHNQLDALRDTISATQVAQRTSIHEERARQFVRTWANDGLVVIASPSHDNYIRLTNAGLRHEFD